MGRADYFAKGDWNAACFECGRKRKASTLKRHWRGYYVCPEHWEPRQPQDFVRGVQDVQTVPWSQPQVDGSVTTNEESQVPSAYYTLAQTMKDNLWGFIQRATGAAAVAAGIPPLVTTDFQVLNQQFEGTALGGYVPSGAASSEGISLMLRGVLDAYKADGDATKLTYAHSLYGAMVTYFFKGAEPTGQVATPWLHHWIVNAGEEFDVRGPLASDNGTADMGYIGTYNPESLVTFTAGVATLNPPPEIVYQVASADAEFVWQNVFSPLTAGTNLEVDYYVTAEGTQVFGAQTGGGYGQPSIPNSGLPPGQIVLTDTTQNGELFVNYCVTVTTTGTQIQNGELYEGWPMWRALGANEMNAAGDALHWMADCFRLGEQVEPTNTGWTTALQSILYAWLQCTANESNTTLMFEAGTAGSYNNFPLTYSFMYGWNSADDHTEWEDIPPNGYQPTRTSDGYVTFDLPLQDGTETGGLIRLGCSFVCQSLFLSYDSSASIQLGVRTSIDTFCQYQITDDVGNLWGFTYLHKAADTEDAVVPIGSFANYGDNVWTPDRSFYTYGSNVTIENEMANLFNGVEAAIALITVPGDDTAGWGISNENAWPYAEWTEPPIICYATTSSNVIYVVKDSDGWLWNCPLPPQYSIAPTPFPWAAFTINQYDPPPGWTGPVPTTPATGNLQGVALTSSSGGGTVKLAYISAQTPAYASSGTIQTFTASNNNNAACVWKVGNVNLNNGARTPIQYLGSLPFGFQWDGPRGNLSITPYRGPIITGYQSATPYLYIQDGGWTPEIDQQMSTMLDFMLEGQEQFTSRNPDGIFGPWMHSYLWATWDAIQYGQQDTWVWDSADGNASWPGWQWRAFDNMARSWSYAKNGGSTAQGNIQKLQDVTTRFLNWINTWLRANPDANYIPSDWGPPGWTMGEPLPPTTYLTPGGNTPTPHDLALVLKATVNCARAGADMSACGYVISRMLSALQTIQVTDTSLNMQGAFTLDPAGYVTYGFEQGEILDALGIALQNPGILNNIVA